MIRKLVKAGPTSLSTSLPIEWIKKNQLKAGSEIRILEQQHNLILIPEKTIEENKINIKYDELLFEDMLEKIFLENYSKITIHGTEKLPKKLIDKITILPGFKIVEESSNQITTERMFELSAKDANTLIKRCYFLIKCSLEKNPALFGKDLHELLFIAKLYKQESAETELLISLIECISAITVRMHDDTFIRLKSVYQSIYEQRFKFSGERARELFTLFDNIDSMFLDYFRNSKQQVILAQTYYAFMLLKKLNKEITKKQSIEILTKIEEKRNQKQCTIGICLKNQSNEFWGTEVPDGINTAYKNDSRMNIIIKYPLTDFNVSQQQKILEKYIENNVDIIIYAPIDPKAIETTLKQINKKGIPLIILDTDLELPRVIYKYIGFNNYHGGRITAEYLLSKLKNKNNLVVLEGHLKGNFSERINGFVSKVGKQNVKIISGEFTGSTAYEKIKEYAIHNKINAIFATSDNMALGATQAMKELHRKVYICGFDATNEGRKAVKTRELLSTINTNPKKLGELAIQTAQDILEERIIPDRIEYDIELITITK
ncbi:MAG: sugar ABC transporter substrate-binding protein [Candidatus Woesearchaeota archaeon]